MQHKTSKKSRKYQNPSRRFSATEEDGNPKTRKLRMKKWIDKINKKYEMNNKR